MRPEDLLKALEAIEDDMISTLNLTADELEAAITERIEAFIEKLEKSGNRVNVSAKNIRAISGLPKVLEAATQGGAYARGVENYAAGYAVTAATINEYFKALEPRFRATKEVYREIQRQAQLATLKSLQGAGISQAVFKPVQDLLRNNIGAGASIADMRKALREYITSTPTVDSRLMRYTKQISTDALSQYNRNYMQAITDDLGLQFGLYEGVKKETSRPFCVARAGKYWHVSEVKSWASQNWQGKIPGTNAANIKTYLGGYNCRHYFIPVAIEAVPESVIQRAREKGFYRD